MSKLFYYLFIKLYPFAVALISPFNAKAKLWLLGRRNIFENLAKALSTQHKIIWMHCASLGEFEQGRPVLEKLRPQLSARYKILVTFFSPSGFVVQKNYSGADYVFYLPMDSKQNAAKFFAIVRPVLILFVKYEYWFYYLNEAKKKRTPLLLISGIFRPDQPFFAWYGGIHKKMLACFTHFFLQNTQSSLLLKQLGYTQNVTVCGDTRFDRVIAVAEKFEGLPAIEKFCGQSKVVVAGSTWTEDDKELDHFANTRTDVKFIIAPHNVGPDRIKECLHLYKNSITYSRFVTTETPVHANTLIIDNVGMLTMLYYYGTVCYVGGAFGADGVHNVLEPAVYGKPVVFGPEYEKFTEAKELLEAGGATSISNTLELEEELNTLLQQNDDYRMAAAKAKQFVYSQSGSTEKIVAYIYENRLLTN